MTTTLLIGLCLILLLAYVFDISASKTRIPAVILLLGMGWLIRRVVEWTGTDFPGLSPVLPLLGTVGLILIVLEGSLELEVTRGKLPVILKALVMAVIPLLAIALGLAALVCAFTDASFVVALTGALPLAIISSSIAIPATRTASPHDREFVIYESSLSDIFGVLAFNFVSLNDHFGLREVGGFGLELLAILALSLVATIGLALLLGRIRHQIKFAPIVLIVILIYGIAKLWHLPGLILILVFGMFLANVTQLARLHWLRGRWQFYYNAAITRLRVDVLHSEVHKLQELMVEATFLVRALFFIVFGYEIQTADLLDAHALVWSLATMAMIYLTRFVALKVARIPHSFLLFIAPRGLITLLLFLSIPAARLSPTLGKPVIVQVIIGTALMMVVGGLLQGNRTPADPSPPLDEEAPVEEKTSAP